MFMSVKREKGHHAVFIPVSFTKATAALNNGIQLLVQRKRGEVDIQIVRRYEYLVLFILKL